MNIQSYHWELMLRKKEKLSMVKALQKRYINQSLLVWWKNTSVITRTPKN